ncbi:Cholesterol 24-hydroxylase [Larimichthys crocea]|uniref:Cholesterol 24-hydroxylase n=1 Tax=Larimichthys crocea TaxID=215358 RepID=A0A6G0I6L1_LARCR|nr:Cholesterol 24-hydroxylase [Larimichthys crocea]
MAVFHLILSWTGHALMFLLVLLFIAFIGYCLYIKYTHLKYDHIPGPPRDSFLFGHSATILRIMRSGGVVHDQFLECTINNNKKEVDEVIGMKKEISYDELGQLVYLSQVLKETLRMYPTAPGTSRDVMEDIVIDGVHIPRGVNCVFSSYVNGRMEKFFKDPLTFDPDRFHPDAPKPYYCYYPFALGPRSCLGQNFAQMEAKVVMAKLLQRFDFSLVPGQSFDILDNGTLRPKSGVVCSVRHRK